MAKLTDTDGNGKIVFMNANGEFDFDNEFAAELNSLNAEALENSQFAIGDRVKLTSACPRDVCRSCSVRVGDIGTLLGLTAWPVNGGVVVMADVRWDHDAEGTVYLGIHEKYLERP